MTLLSLGKASFALSVAAHAGLFAVDVEVSSPKIAESLASEVEFFDVAPSLEPQPSSPPPAEIEPDPPSPKPVARTISPQDEEPKPASESETAAEDGANETETEADELTGSTLVVDGEGPFRAPPGSGRVRRGVFRAGASHPRPAQVPKARRLTTPPAPSGPRVVALGKLSRLPEPPALGGALRKNYPRIARKQGRGGEASVRARVEPNGKILKAQILHESGDGFGDACERTLLQSRWGRPLDAQGTPVATWINYRCKFRIDD